MFPKAWIEQHQSQCVNDLCDWLRIPSVSADPARRDDCRAAARWAEGRLAKIGFRTEFVETSGHPIVYAEWLRAPGSPTVLVYGHYDVQPADPLNLWTTPAFEPAIRDGYVFARGATDDKGQLFTHIASCEAWIAERGSLPVNIKFVIEGEEEVGSKNLDQFLESRASDLACDVAVVSDTSQFGPNQPAITYGLRGILAAEFTVTGPKKDLHSGIFGGAVANPANGLARLIASLHNAHGRVQIPGFYDSVRPLTAVEVASMNELPFSQAAFLAELGSVDIAGERGFSTLERRWARPTCDVNGMFGGYQGEGPKTIIPSRATAKVTCRLVPDQDPEQLTDALEAHLRANLPPGLTLEFRRFHGCPAFAVDLGNRYVQAAVAAIEDGFGTRPKFIREGGSIPVVASLRTILGVDTLLLGWGQNTDNLHSPDEHFSLADFQRGILSSAALWNRLAKLPQKP